MCVKRKYLFISISICTELATFFWCDEPEWKEKLKTNAMSRLEYYLDKFETILKANNGYFVGNKVSTTRVIFSFVFIAQFSLHNCLSQLTWADIFFASLKAYLSNMAERDITANHPNLAKLVNEVYGLPNIKAYLEKAPKTKFWFFWLNYVILKSMEEL